jgi:hypothetical protein
VFALVCTVPAVLLNKYSSDTNSVAQSERAGEHNGLAVDGGGDRGSSDVVIGSSDVKNGSSDVKIGSSDVKIGSSDVKIGSSDVKNGSSDVKIGSSDVKIGSSVVIIGSSVGGFTGSVNEAHIILSPTNSGYLLAQIALSSTTTSAFNNVFERLPPID